MTREQAREFINNRLPYELKKANKKATGYDTYICPFCDNGSGKDGDGICSKDGKHYKCFKCGFYGDYLDILKKNHGTEKENDIFTIYKLAIDSTRPYTAAKNNSAKYSTQQAIPKMPNADYRQYFKECNAKYGQTDYFSKRGISAETINKFMLGYDPVWKYPNAPNATTTARIIIPTSKGSYIARAVEPDAHAPKMKVGASCLFNSKALQSTEQPYIFVVEGEFDALSVIEVGGQAVALGSVSNANKFIEAVKNSHLTATLVLSLDNDDSGRKAQSELKERLEKLKVDFSEANISGIYKDPNEALQNNRAYFAEIVRDPTNQSEKKSEYVKAKAVSGSLDTFKRLINDTVSTHATPTGFNILDTVLDGGFYEGLYVLGAISSIGKTSICLQIADQIAQHGEDVIIFSLEMSKNELMSKSVSRLTFIEDNRKNGNGFHYARTSRQISTGVFHDEREKELVETALQRYSDYGNNLYIYERSEIIGTEQIRQSVKEHFDFTCKRPVVMVDYLQILTPCDTKSSDKQNIDKAVLELKRLSMEYKIPVLAVSSFNRENYLNPVNMSSFKESGAIEYSSDVLLGLQFKGMDEINKNNSMKIEEWRRSDCRSLELKVLKNRNGASGENICFEYYPRFNFFKETDKSKNERRNKI